MDAEEAFRLLAEGAMRGPDGPRSKLLTCAEAKVRRLIRNSQARILGNNLRSEADDAEQEAWTIVFFHKVDQYMGVTEGSFTGWIRTTAHRKAVDILRKNLRKHDAPANGSGPDINSTRPTAFAPTIDPSPISIPDDHRGTEIHYAAANGDADRVRSLIKSSKDLVNAKNKAGLTPLHLAASNGHNDVAEVLLANNADVNPRDWQGATPMQLAATQGEKVIVYLLLKYGAKE